MLSLAEGVKWMNEYAFSFISFLCGECPVDMLFNLVLITSIVFGAYFEVLGVNNKIEFLSVIGVLLLIWTIVDIAVRFHLYRRGRMFACKIIHLTEFMIVALGVPCYFFGVGLSIYKRPYFDKALLKFDTLCLGWVFPQGQISLYLDQSESLNPSTAFGKFYSELLQFCYVTYYVWPYLVCMVPTARCILSLFENRYYKPANSQEDKKNWHEHKLVLSIWALSYLFTFLINSLIPASSPRLFLADEYEHEITGFFLAKLFRGFAKENRSANSFPSGHVGETLASALTALWVLKYKKFGWFLVFVTVLMTSATVVLRYHYFADALLGAIIGFAVVGIGMLAQNGTFTFQKKEEDNEPKVELDTIVVKSNYNQLEESDEMYVTSELNSVHFENEEELVERSQIDDV